MFIFEILKAILFGIVEGVTEWLPVSSTGHMILLDEFIALRVSESFYDAFEVIIQLGAIFAVILRFRGKLLPLSKDGEQRRSVLRLWSLLFIAALPSAVTGLVFDELLDRYLYNPYTVAAMLIIYGVVFAVIEKRGKYRGCRIVDVGGFSRCDALRVGLFQTLALIPGTSRSGATVLGGIMIGASRSAAAEFSFLLAVPTMLGAGGLRTVKYFAKGNVPTSQEICLLAVGALVAFALSAATVGFLTDYVKRHSFATFGIYRIALGVLVLLYFLCF